jgi:uncharacterized membrane protein AbrB (regulator of aidB expression)
MTDAAEVTGDQLDIACKSTHGMRGQTCAELDLHRTDRRVRWVQILVGIIVGCDFQDLLFFDFSLSFRPLYVSLSILLVVYALLAWRFGWQTRIRRWAMIIISVVHIGGTAYELHLTLSNIGSGSFAEYQIAEVVGLAVTILPAMGVIALLLSAQFRRPVRPAPVIDERILSVIDEPY